MPGLGLSLGFGTPSPQTKGGGTVPAASETRKEENGTTTRIHEDGVTTRVTEGT